VSPREVSKINNISICSNESDFIEHMKHHLTQNELHDINRENSMYKFARIMGKVYLFYLGVLYSALKKHYRNGEEFHIVTNR